MEDQFKVDDALARKVREILEWYEAERKRIREQQDVKQDLKKAA